MARDTQAGEEKEGGCGGKPRGGWSWEHRGLPSDPNTADLFKTSQPAQKTPYCRKLRLLELMMEGSMLLP